LLGEETRADLSELSFHHPHFIMRKQRKQRKKRDRRDYCVGERRTETELTDLLERERETCWRDENMKRWLLLEGNFFSAPHLSGTLLSCNVINEVVEEGEQRHS
jgi:hypothetical protein